MTTSWDTTDVLKAPMEVCWQFSYDIDQEELSKLYSKAKKFQWNAESDMNWDYEIDPSRPLIDEDRFGLSAVPFVQSLPKSQQEALRAHIAAYQLSQFLHGEQGALMTAAALTHAVPDYEGKLYAATQTMDEARHVEVYDRYIKKLAMIYPMGEWLKKLIDITLTADHWVKIAIGMNMVVEGLALGSFHNMRNVTGCELLKEILHYVMRDEARHVAFGGFYVGKTIEQMHEDDREDVAEFAFEALKLMRGSKIRSGPQFDGGFLQVLQAVNIDPADLVKGVMEARQQGVKVKPPSDQVHAFKHLMMPALFRVGAITPRTREKLVEAEIPIWEDRSVLESMEEKLETMA
ncbi:MAG: ferritin-like domain-containing protein [Myxococcales bacterium]|nr:ferritin-like domain-containing protein [Myxococcales bacterium]